MLLKEKNILRQLGVSGISRIVSKIISRAKGEKDRITILPEKLIETLKNHIQKVKNLHNHDLKIDLGRTILPYALERKYPNADKAFI